MDQWEELTNDMSRIRDLDRVLQDQTKQDVKEAFKEQGLEKEMLKSATEAVASVKEAAHDLVTQQFMGHKPRATYLQHLLSDLKRGDEDVRFFVSRR